MYTPVNNEITSLRFSEGEGAEKQFVSARIYRQKEKGVLIVQLTDYAMKNDCG